MRRAVLSLSASYDRRDFELNLLFFAPDAELEFPSGLRTLGLAGTFRGHEGRIEGLNKVIEVWGSSQFEPAYILDLGDRMLHLALWRNQASASGVPLEQEFANLVTVRDGLMARDQLFFSWEEGLAAAGLDRDWLSRPRG